MTLEELERRFAEIDRYLARHLPADIDPDVADSAKLGAAKTMIYTLLQGDPVASLTRRMFEVWQSMPESAGGRAQATQQVAADPKVIELEQAAARLRNAMIARSLR